MASHEQCDKAQAHPDEVIEYDSDSEEGTTASTFRRRAASDDEEDEPDTNTARSHQYYDEEDEDQGAPPGEEEEEEDEEDAEGEEEEYDDAEDVGELSSRKDEFGSGEAWPKDQQEDRGASAGKASPSPAGSSVKGRVEEEKKELEPFVVPTAGAFYMHDDRFRYNGVPRPRRGAGGRRLWEAKDEKPWLHDRFEELKLNEDNYFGQGVRGRRGRGRQGRGLSRGKGYVHARGKGNKEWVAEDANQFNYRHGRGRGRGVRRAKMDEYEFKEPQSAGNRILSSTSQESSTAAGTSKFPMSRTTVKSQDSASKKPTTSSILNSASPPFFPTGAVSHNLNGVLSAANKDDKVNEKDVQQMGRATHAARNAMEKGLSAPLTAAKPVSSSGNLTSLSLVSSTEVDTSAHRNVARSSTTIQQQPLKTGPGSIIQQHRSVRTETNSQRLIEQPAVSAVPQQQSRETLPAHPVHVQQQHQSLQQISPVQVSHSQSQPTQSQSVPISSNPVADVKAAPASAANKIGSSTTGRGTQVTAMQPGMGTFVYGSSSLTNGLHSVVQFAGQPQPGLGVPVALPGYSNQPQFGFPNSEVTWIPILAGGSMGSNYSSPYIAMDGNSPAVYYTQASQPSSFSVPGRDPAGSKTGTSGLFKPSGRPEPDELGQQRKRYSQMTFGEERR